MIVLDRRLIPSPSPARGEESAAVPFAAPSFAPASRAPIYGAMVYEDMMTNFGIFATPSKSLSMRATGIMLS